MPALKAVFPSCACPNPGRRRSGTGQSCVQILIAAPTEIEEASVRREDGSVGGCWKGKWTRTAFAKFVLTVRRRRRPSNARAAREAPRVPPRPRGQAIAGDLEAVGAFAGRAPPSSASAALLTVARLTKRLHPGRPTVRGRRRLAMADRVRPSVRGRRRRAQGRGISTWPRRSGSSGSSAEGPVTAQAPEPRRVLGPRTERGPGWSRSSGSDTLRGLVEAELGVARPAWTLPTRRGSPRSGSLRVARPAWALSTRWELPPHAPRCPCSVL